MRSAPAIASPSCSTGRPHFATARVSQHATPSSSSPDPAMSADPTIRQLNTLGEAEIEQLAAVLVDCVEGGASVSFMLPLTQQRAAEFWRRLAAEVASGGRLLLVAE